MRCCCIRTCNRHYRQYYSTARCGIKRIFIISGLPPLVACFHQRAAVPSFQGILPRYSDKQIAGGIKKVHHFHNLQNIFSFSRGICRFIFIEMFPCDRVSPCEDPFPRIRKRQPFPVFEVLFPEIDKILYFLFRNPQPPTGG